MAIKIQAKKKKSLHNLNRLCKELKAHVSEIEKGPFYTLEEGKAMVNKWREERKNA